LDWSCLSCCAFNKHSYTQSVINTNVGSHSKNKVNKEVIVKRLSIIKLLYRQGVQQSYLPETISFFSILSFHDSIEMFIKLAAEERDINSDKWNFLDYWDKVSELTMKEAARGLNLRRVNLKHKGLIPAKVEV
jgi:hypothetical protein